MRILIITLLIGTTTLGAAQTDLPTGQIEVIKDFEVRLAETRKIRIQPEATPFDTAVRRYVYTLAAPSPTISYAVPDIKPLAIEPEQKPTYYPFVARAGYGSPNSWLGHIAYDRRQNASFGWSGELNYLSADSKKIPLQKFSNIDGRLEAYGLLKDQLRLTGHADVGVHSLYLYGAEEIPDNPDALLRRYHRYDVGVRLEEFVQGDNRFGYHAGLQILADSDNRAAKETSLVLTGGIQGTLGFDIPYGVNARADVTTYKQSEEHELNNFLLMPWLDYALGDLRLYAGATVLLNEAGDAILPDLEISYPLLGPLLTVRAGWKGHVQKNNFHTLTSYNPYLQDRLDTLLNTVSRDIYAGVAGKGGRLTYDVSASYTRFEDLAFFLQDPGEPEVFQPVYDRGYYIGLEGVLAYELLPRLTVNGRVFQRIYKPETESKPWHRPSFGADGFISYAGDGDTWHVSLLLHTENGLPYRTPGGTESRLKALVDLNLHGDYFITPFLGAFVQVNNLLNNQRERWVRYPSFGFNAKAGVVLRLE